MVAEATTETPVAEPLVTPEPTEVKGQETELSPDLRGEAESAPGNTEGAEPEFKLEELASWKEAGLGDAKVAEVELPGEPLEAIQAKLSTQRAQGYSQILNQGNVEARGVAEQLGLDDADGQRLANWLVGKLANMYQWNEDYNSALLRETTKHALPPEDYAKYGERQYTNRVDHEKALVALGEQRLDEVWKAKVKAGEFVPRDSVSKIATESFNAGRAQRDSVDGKTSSNVLPKGGSPSGSLTYDQIQKMSPSQIEALPGDVFMKAIEG